MIYGLPDLLLESWWLLGMFLAAPGAFGCFLLYRFCSKE